MGRRRKYDYDAILNRRAAGERVVDIAHDMGLTQSVVQSVVDNARMGNDPRARLLPRTRPGSYVVAPPKPRPRPANATPSEMILRVLDLARDGNTMSVIADKVSEEFGVVKTRNAIIGIINRNRAALGDVSRKERTAIPTVPKPSPPRPSQSRVSNNHVGGRALRPVAVAAPDAPPVPDGGVPLVELQHHHCRAISGRGADGLATFCGADKVHGSYCAAHARMFYAPARQVTDKWADYLAGSKWVVKRGSTAEQRKAVDHVFKVRGAA